MQPDNFGTNPDPNLTPPVSPVPPAPAPPTDWQPEQPIVPPGNVQPPVMPPVPVVASPSLPPAPPPAANVVVPELNDNVPAAFSTPGQVVSGGFEPPAPYGAAGPAPIQPPSQPLPPFDPSAVPPAGPVFGGFDPAQPQAAPLFGGAAPVPAAPLSPPPSKKRLLKPLLAALAAILVLGGGSAAAYFGVVVPNKPANVLKTAFINSLQQTQTSSSGTASASGSGVAYKATFSSAENSVAKSADFQLNLTVSGITFPVEARLVDQNLYIKVGDLSTISGLIGTFVPSAGTMVQSLNSDLSNQWIVVDSTLLNESSGVRCVLNSSWTLSNSDVQLLGNQYSKHPFAAIQSTSNSTVGGKPAEKFVLNVSNASLNDFGNGVLNLSVLKNLSKCLGGTATSTPSTDHGHTPLTVWVDKSTKRIVQVAASSNAKGGSVSGSVTVTLHYGKVSITAPSNAKPALQVLTDIENSAKADPSLLNLFGGGSTAASTGSTSDTLFQ